METRRRCQNRPVSCRWGISISFPQSPG
jgi:hypothetical protein